MAEQLRSSAVDQRADDLAKVSASAELCRSDAPLTIRENIDSLSASLSSQIELLAQELRAQWRAGKRVGVESLGQSFEQISSNEEQLLDLIYHEVLIREEFGEKPRVDDFTPRFPQLTERLQRLFAVHGALEDDAWDDELEAAFNDQLPEPTPEDSLVGNRGPSSTELDAAPEAAKKQWPRQFRHQRPVDPPPGYELLEEIGRGGMAVVFRARQQILNRTVAIKMLLAGSVASDEVLARIQQEAQAVAQLQYAGIVQIYEVGTHRGLPYLSLEYVPGGTLYEWLGGRPLPAQEAARIIEQLARSTHFAHERGIVHRDLKPANVLLTERPPSLQSGTTVAVAPQRENDPTPSLRIETKISDFGLAKVLGSRSDLTATGQVIGTPSYMAPEQAAGASDDASPAQDIYSLGAILYELLTGRPPFRGATLFDTLEQVRSNEAVPPRQLQPRIPRDIETICLKCLEKLPPRRYATALLLAEDLQRFQQGDSIAARPAGLVEKSLKLVRRYPTIASLLALVVVLTIGGIIGISREAARANRNERDAVFDRDRANEQRKRAQDQWKRAEEQKALADAERLKSAEQARIAVMARASADQQRQLAEEAQSRAEEQSRLAEKERARAVDLQAQAEKRFDRTLQVLKTNVDSALQLKNDPQTQVAGQKMLDEALRLYEELAKEEGDHPALRRQRIIALSAAARILQAKQQNSKAEALLKDAEKHLQAGLDATPDDMDLHYHGTSVYWTLGVLYNNSGRPSDALNAWRRDIQSIDKLLAYRPDLVAYMLTKANALINEAVSLQLLGRRQEAFNSLEQAVSLVRSALPRMQADWMKSEASLVLHDYSKALRDFGRIDDGDRVFNEAFVLRREVHQRNPDDPNGRIFLARMYADMGRRQRYARDFERSVNNLQQAFELLETLVKRNPEIYEYHRDRNAYAIDRVRTAIAMNDVSSGKRHWIELLALLDETQKKFPDDLAAAEAVATWHYEWSEVLWEEADYTTATEHLAQAFASSVQSVPLSIGGTQSAFLDRLNSAAWRFAVAPTQERSYLPTAEILIRAAITLSKVEPTQAMSLNHRHTLGTVLLRRRKLDEAKTTFLEGIRLMQPAEYRLTEDELVAAIRQLPAGDSGSVRQQFISRYHLVQASPYTLTHYFLQLADLLWRMNDKEAARQALRLVGEPARGNRLTGAELRRLVSEVRALHASDPSARSNP